MQKGQDDPDAVRAKSLQMFFFLVLNAVVHIFCKFFKLRVVVCAIFQTFVFGFLHSVVVVQRGRR